LSFDNRDKEIKKGNKKKRKINWREYNESLVRRREVMFGADFLSNWRTELEEMNKGKEGAKYRYPNPLISLLATVHAYLLPYKQLKVFLRTLSKYMVQLQEVPDFTTMWWRVVKVKLKLNPEINPEENGEKVTIVVDATGIKVSNRGDWTREKWMKHRRRGFIKIHVAVNVKTKKIVSMKVTKEDVADGEMLKPLVQQVSMYNKQNNCRRCL
jgi:hypothetical protein